MVETKIPGVYGSGSGNITIKSGTGGGGTTTGFLKGLFGSATTVPMAQPQTQTQAAPTAPMEKPETLTAPIKGETLTAPMEKPKTLTAPIKGETAVNAIIPASNEAGIKTTLADLKNQYAANLKSGYDYAAEKLKNERDADLREQYIKNRIDETALPERLAKYGINGGAVETTLADLKARYQSGRNTARQNYLTSIADLGQKYMSDAAEANRAADERWLNYLMTTEQNRENQRTNYLLDSERSQNERYLDYLYGKQRAEEDQWLNYLLDNAAYENKLKLQKQYEA